MRLAVNLRDFVPGGMGNGMEVYARQAVGALDDRLTAAGGSLVVYAGAEQHATISTFAPAAELVAVEPGVALANDELARCAADALLCPLNFLDPPLPELPAAVMISDVYPELEPQLLNRSYRELTRQALRRSARCADVVLTMHESTADAIAERYGVERERIVVTPPAVDDDFAALGREPSAAFTALGLPARFLYYPASFYPHKNHAALLGALALLTEDDVADVPLVLTGADALPAELAAEIGRLGLADRVRALGRVDRELVLELHRRATAVTFVSRFEGFGIPPIEAMLAGTPVLASSEPVVRDVVGDAALVIDEQDPEAIAAGIRRLLRDATLRDDLRERGRARAARFAPAAANAALLDALRGIARTGRRGDVAVRYEPPTVGIVTPCYDAAPFLAETIDSVLEQDYPHVRYVVMDGGSTDGSVDVLRSYGEWIDWTSGPDGGQADAINRGIERVGGDIVAFLNADDAYEPGAIATAVERFRDRPGMAMIWGTARVLDAADRHVLTTMMEPTDHVGLARANPIHQPAAFVSGHAWREVGGLDEQLELALDYDLWIRLSDGVQIAAVPDVLARVRFHPAAKTESHRGRHFREAMRVVRRHYGHVPATWTGVYARWLAAGRPSAVAELPRSRRSTALQLPIGLYANPHAPLRTVREWVADSGIGRFEGRWHDDWISRRWRTSVAVPAGADRVRIKGMHHAMRRRPLGLRASLDGERVASIDLREPGEFVLESALDPALRGRESVLTVQASYTFRVPTDARRLSCQIAEVSFE